MRVFVKSVYWEVKKNVGNASKSVNRMLVRDAIRRKDLIRNGFHECEVFEGRGCSHRRQITLHSFSCLCARLVNKRIAGQGHQTHLTADDTRHVYLVLGARQVLVHGSRRAGQDGCHDEDVDCGIRQAVQKELLVNDVLVVLAEQVFDRSSKVVDAANSQCRPVTQRRSHYVQVPGSRPQTHGFEYSFRSFVQNETQVIHRVVQSSCQLLQVTARALQT